MFKNHPKGLIGAALSNIGERLGFYVMMAILVLFLEAKFGFGGTTKGVLIYTVFFTSIYVLALVGGIIADRTRKYKGTIGIGLVLMMIGYVIIAWPTPTPAPNKTLSLVFTCFGLFAIAFGNGLFKGNLQAVVGQLYDNPTYSGRRDVGFQIFYMFINVGAMFSPILAVGVRNWYVQSQGFGFNQTLPDLCNQYLSGTMTPEAMERFTGLAAEVSRGPVADLGAFAQKYLSVFVTGYHYAFIVAAVAMLISIFIFMANRKRLPDPAKKVVNKDAVAAAGAEMTLAEIKQRIYALFAVFGVVIFFWFSFHQNGVTLTYFAKDYTNLEGFVINLGFMKLEGAEMFQAFNPMLVVLLTPIVIGFFGWLKAKGKEPSTPKKIVIGMGIATAAFIVMALGSQGLPTKEALTQMGGLEQARLVTPWLLIGTYFILTVAELFISPLGLSFVSKVAPPKYQGLMQGAWLSATAIGNSLLILGAVFYNNIPIWATWMVFAVACALSMGTMLAMLKWLERVSK